MSTLEPAAILQAIRGLPRVERLRLVGKVIHELAQDDRAQALPSDVVPSGKPEAIIGMMADEPDLMDEVCALAMKARLDSRMRTLDD